MGGKHRSKKGDIQRAPSRSLWGSKKLVYYSFGKKDSQRKTEKLYSHQSMGKETIKKTAEVSTACRLRGPHGGHGVEAWQHNEVRI